MTKAWHLRKDGNAYPVPIHLYPGDQCYEETAMCGEWLWDKCLNPDEFRPKFLSFMHTWVDNEYDGDVDGMYQFVEDVGPDLVPSIPFLKIHEKEFMSAPIGDLTQLSKYIGDVLNSEFIRVRFGGTYDDMGTKELVFRVTQGYKFNWFDAIYVFVSRQKRPLGVQSISIVKDYGGLDDEPYKDGNVVFENMPVEDFLTYQKTPYIERLKRNK